VTDMLVPSGRGAPRLVGYGTHKPPAGMALSNLEALARSVKTSRHAKECREPRLAAATCHPRFRPAREIGSD